MKHNSKIYVAGHQGLVGSALLRTLAQKGFTHIVCKEKEDLDLRNQLAVQEFFAKVRPEYIFLAAAKVGGIKANMDYPAQFIYDNLLISAHVIDAAFKYGIKKLLFLGSSCIYPRECQQPIKEDYLLTSQLEKSNEPYAIAKIAGIKMCQAYNMQYGTNFISCMPTNLYGPHDNFDLETSHVIPALISKFYTAYITNAKEVVVWGSGTQAREFLYVDDAADACLFLMHNYDQHEIINIGTGSDITMYELAHLIKDIIGFKGKIIFDITKPDGTQKKLLDICKLSALGWKAKTSLDDGIKKTIHWFIENKNLYINQKKEQFFYEV
jgi:GDP-L-fucose synthase